ncbi:Ribosomal protein arginine N-methyltransferase [Podosphaera aphanis]|nr:Ribosomal protein arginine N-methyltransferase [Podosphaera aphanis]
MADTAPETRAEASDSENSDILDMRGEEGWQDLEPDQEEVQFVSLLDDKVFPDIHQMLDHCREKHGFDFLGLRRSLKLDFYDTIKLVNFVRTHAHAAEGFPSKPTKEDFQDEKFLMPVLDDDAVLFNLDELPDISENDDSTAPDESEKSTLKSSELVARVSVLEEQLRRVQLQFESYRATVSQTLDDRWHQKKSIDYTKASDDTKDKPEDDNHYFKSYSYNDIHETMLKDTVRTDAYRDFIYDNKDLFVGKTVLDVGCGTGILSMFCAKAGAACVIAVDNSAIIDKARENIFHNGLADKITCLRGKIEEVTLPVKSVDIIISEWMGYCLLYEAMLESVIWARDHYLRPDGLMVPSHMNMWVAPVTDPEYIAEHFLFWRNVYGFDMKAMLSGVYDDAQVLQMPPGTICGEAFPFLQLSLHETTVQDLTFTKPWHSAISKEIDSLDGFAVWFDTFFMPSRSDTVPESASAENWTREGKKGVAFTTGPSGKLTHWKQGVLFIDKTKDVPRKCGEEITAQINYSIPEENSRALNIRINWKIGDEPEKIQSWKMI